MEISDNHIKEIIAQIIVYEAMTNSSITDYGMFFYYSEDTLNALRENNVINFKECYKCICGYEFTINPAYIDKTVLQNRVNEYLKNNKNVYDDNKKKKFHNLTKARIVDHFLKYHILVKI